MKKGRLSTAEYDRAVTKFAGNGFVDKPFTARREGLSVADHIKKAANAKAKKNLYTETLSGTESVVAECALLRAVLAAEAAYTTPKEAAATLIFPPNAIEPVVRPFVIALAHAAAKEEVTISDISVRREEVKVPIISVTVTGESEKRAFSEGDEYSLLMIGSAGIEGSILLRERYAKTLEARYGKDFLDTEELRESLYTARAIRKLRGMFDYAEVSGEGGVYACLEKLSSRLHLGFDVDITKINILPLTVEICETLDINPYKMMGGGCVIAATNVPEAASAVCAEMGVKYSVLGTLNKSNDKRVLNQDEVRFVDSFKADSMNLIKQED